MFKANTKVSALSLLHSQPQSKRSLPLIDLQHLFSQGGQEAALVHLKRTDIQDWQISRKLLD